jgi:copper(I)-binding protein
VNAPRLRHLLVALAVASSAITVAACGSDDGDSSGAAEDGGVTVSDVRVREPAEGVSATAAYGVITNDTGHTVTLVGASTPLTDDVQLHETLTGDDGAMSMQEEGGFAIEAGASLSLEPGGAHVMLLDVDAADVTDPVDITFEFDGADPVTVSATVEALGAGTDDMDDIDDMDDTDTVDSTDAMEDQGS